MSDSPTETAKESWQTDVLPEINDECLDCIRTVESIKDDPAKEHNCTIHDWPQATHSERKRCGPYDLSPRYYELCGYPKGEGEANFEACAFDRDCARGCVKRYTNRNRHIICGRPEIGDRMCVDYGALHAFEERGCLLRNDINVRGYRRLMVENCGVEDPPPVTKVVTTTPKPVAGVVVGSVIGVTVVLVLVIVGLIYFLRKRSIAMKYRDPERRNTNLYNRELVEGGSGLACVFDYTKCSEDIQNMLQSRQISIQDLDLKEEIGKGQFGIIRRAILYLDSEHTESAITAVKMLRTSIIKEDDINDILREAHTMYKFDHLNVLSIIGIVWKRGDPPLVVLPYMGKGSLLDLVRKEDSKFTPADLLNFVVQIAAGLEYLESLKFVHRDIALRNCLVTDFYVVKISDFGLSRDVYDTGIYDCDDGSDRPFDITEKRLPWKWLAPECLSSGIFTHKSDVWAFGILIWELYNNGRPPYPAIGNISVLQECLAAGYRLSKPDTLQPEIYDLMKNMWLDDAKNRPSLAEIHSEIQKVKNSTEMELSYSYTGTERPIVPRKPPKRIAQFNKQRSVSQESAQSYVDFKPHDHE